MQKRKLGRDLEVSALGLGCMSMTSAYGPAADKGEMIKMLRAAHDLGVHRANLTALTYLESRCP
jgi:aryl-alcohol dehydrogenase-like predicted oxidoreductase